ncbi:MAG: carbonic anhydrase [Nitrospirae bacterium]|nr:carbonic anhydrase [Nitrospirota bacterium]
MTNRLISISSEWDIPEVYRKTSISKLILYHNLNLPSNRYKRAEILTLMCMDNRQSLRLPGNFSFIVRNGGGTQNGASFSISFAVAVGGIRHIAVIGHSDCMMVNLGSRKAEFIRGLSEGSGWDKAAAESHFIDSCVLFNKEDVVSSVIAEAELIRSQHTGIVVAPMLYSVEDDLLYLIEEN